MTYLQFKAMQFARGDKDITPPTYAVCNRLCRKGWMIYGGPLKRGDVSSFDRCWVLTSEGKDELAKAEQLLKQVEGRQSP